MKAAIVWICAVASLCGSIDGSVLRVDETRNPRIVEAETDRVIVSDEDYSDNKVEANFEVAREEQPVETTTEYKYKELLEPYVNRRSSTTQRTIDPEQVLAGILKRKTTTWRPRPQQTFSTRDEQIEPKPETTTEYKYKDLVEPYIVPQPQYIPMKHVAGTHYVKVERGQNEYERVIEDYNRLFVHSPQPVLPDYAPPPKF